MGCLFIQEEGANLSPSVAREGGGTSHSASMVISRCHSPRRRSEGFLTSVRKRGSLHCTPPNPPNPFAFFSCWGSSSSSNRGDRERERGMRGRDRGGYIGGLDGSSLQPVDAGALAAVPPLQLHGKSEGQVRGCW